MIKSIDELTPSTLTQVFRVVCRNPSVEVTQVDSKILTLQTAHNALLFRLKMSYADWNHRGPESAIAKLPEDGETIYEHRQLFQPGTKELWFYRNIADICSIGTPKLYFGQGAKETGVATLLLEDLGHLEAVSQVRGIPDEDMQLAVAGIGCLHANWWGRTDIIVFRELNELTAEYANVLCLTGKTFRLAVAFVILRG